MEMHRFGGRAVDQRAVMAAEKQGARPSREKGGEPEVRFEVEMVGGFVEKQQVGFGEQRGGEGGAHPPASGQRVERRRPGAGVEPEAAKDRRGARRRGVGGDFVEARMNSGEARPLRAGVRLGEQARSLAVGGENECVDAPGPGRRGLRDMGEAGAARQFHNPGVAFDLAGDQPQQGALAGAVAPHQRRAVALGDGEGRAFEHCLSVDAVMDIPDLKHGRYAPRNCGKPSGGKFGRPSGPRRRNILHWPGCAVCVDLCAGIL